MTLVVAQDPVPDEGRVQEPTLALAEFIFGLRQGGVPHTMRAIIEDAVLDSIGCAMFGLTTDACRIVQEFALDEGGPAQASIWGAGCQRRVSMANAALSNGVAIHGFDFDDHSRAKIHPGAVVIPAAFAAAEYTESDGHTLLAAIAAGYEVMNRVSLAANPNASRTKGWHLTGTTGTFAAAAAASVVLGLNLDATASALGIAGSQSSGLWAFNADGAMTKRLHPGLAARSGITAAVLARRGFTGPHSVLEADDGGFLAATSDEPRLAEITRGLGREWRAEGACFKPYACCGSNHASIDAALSLKRTNGFTTDDVEEIEIGVSRVVLLQTGFEYRKTTVLNAQMSIRYNVAVALLDEAALVEQFTRERLDDPKLNALIARTKVVVDKDMDAVYPGRYAGIVIIRLKDGRKLRERVDFSKGMPENRIPSEELKAKFLSLAGTAIGTNAAQMLLGDLAVIFDSPNVAPLAGRLSAVAVRPQT